MPPVLRKILNVPQKAHELKACSAVFGSGAEIMYVPLIVSSGKNLETAWLMYGHKSIPL